MWEISETYQAAARKHAYSLPLGEIDPSDATFFENDTLWPYFERLRAEDPIHENVDPFGNIYWSASKYEDIVKIDNDHVLFSPLASTTSTLDPVTKYRRGALISKSPPEHTNLRGSISPIFGSKNVNLLEPIVRERIRLLLNDFDHGQELNFVTAISSEVVSIMFGALLGMPWEDCRKLPRWHDVYSNPDRDLARPEDTEEIRRSELLASADYFFDLLRRKQSEPPEPNLISTLAHNRTPTGVSHEALMGHIIGLILGGTHTVRSAITGSVLALNQHPSEYEKLQRDQSLISGMILETLRWQTPLGFIHRVATQDCKIRNKAIKQGQFVRMWYLSGNRDEDIFENPNNYNIERTWKRQHLAFGYGIHHCLGNRLAELMMRTFWEEVYNLSLKLEVIAHPVRFRSCFVRDYESLAVKIFHR